MIERLPIFVDPKTLRRIDFVFTALDYQEADAEAWLGESNIEVDADGKRPVFVWEREILARDIINGSELTATDLLAMLRNKTGRLTVERWVTLDQEDDDGEEELSFAVNMYSGELLQDQPDPNVISMIEQFKSKFRQVEEYGQA